MSATAAFQNLVRATDTAVARLALAVARERDALMSFLFHSLFADEREIAAHHVDPLQRTTVSQFRQFIEHYLEHGYRFVSPADVLKGLDACGKYALISFDDGYFNNARALPVLREFNVPATFFIATDHVQQNKCYWWDVLYRERAAQGASHDRIYREAVALKCNRTEDMERDLSSRFGPRAFVPRNDLDRPFTPAELRDFAADPHVTLGNHTAGHAILTNYTPEQVRAQVSGAQAALREMTGVTPTAIAYPNGAHNAEVVRICREVGLKVGFTTRPEKSDLPLADGAPGLMRLGRFATHGDSPIVRQCRTYRSDLLIYGVFRDGYLRFCRDQVGQ